MDCQEGHDKKGMVEEIFVSSEVGQSVGKVCQDQAEKVTDSGRIKIKLNTMIDVLDPLQPTFMNLLLPDLVLVGEMIPNTYKNVKIDESLRKSETAPNWKAAPVRGFDQSITQESFCGEYCLQSNHPQMKFPKCSDCYRGCQCSCFGVEYHG